jgi:hypothetical protein
VKNNVISSNFANDETFFLHTNEQSNLINRSNSNTIAYENKTPGICLFGQGSLIKYYSLLSVAKLTKVAAQNSTNI